MPPPPPSQLDPSPFPSSPYAVELENGPRRRFAPTIEAEYVRSHLLENRALIRAACVVAAVTSARGAVTVAFGSVPGIDRVVEIGLLLVVAGVLLSLAWSRRFADLYLPIARRLVPVRNLVAGALVAGVAADGRLESLMTLPLMVVGPLFFMGLPFGVALTAVVFVIASFFVNGLAMGLALPLVLRCSTTLLLVTVAAAIAARHIEKMSRRSFLERRMIAEFAEHDALTGLNNRRVFDERIEQLWERAVATRGSVAVFLVDVDRFKAYNDFYGHQAGDQTLRRVAGKLQALFSRSSDVLVRYGGEEFAAVVYDIGGDEARALGERARRGVSDLAIEHRGAGNGRVTISVGIAVVEPTSQRRPRGALQLADQALYEAKARGRDRVYLLDQAAHDMLVTGVFQRDVLAQRQR
ncbi:MAG TPA: diguanylate cyclase [Gammaproteobacteria bacterium]